MLSLSFFFVIALVLLTGAAIKIYLDKINSQFSITKTEFIIGAVICCVLIVPLTLWVGTSVAKANSIDGYHEFWGGYETRAFSTTDVCNRDGSCAHTYQCDPYEVLETYTYTDSNGDTHTGTRLVTKYHDCPYENEELSYYVDTTLGRYTIAADIFPSNPAAHEWRSGHSYPGDVETGVPPFWAQAKARIAAGNPGSVTQEHTYKNYILASQATILHNYSDLMNTYLKAGLLPKVTTKVGWPYIGAKTYFVGQPLANAQAWSDAVNKFDAAFGVDKQGDMHFIVVTDPKVTNPDDWFNALTAYWEGSKLGKHDISKNGLIVAVGTTDGKTVAWARAATGMPVGNEELLSQIETNLKGQPLDPSTLIGTPTGKIYTDPTDGKLKAKVVHSASEGTLEKLVWGSPGFVRVCMGCKSKGDKGVGFGYLSGQIQPSTGAKVLIGFLAFLFSSFVWAALVAIGTRPGSPLRRSYGY